MIHTPEATALANLTLWTNLVKTLGNKGILSDAEYTALLNGAIGDLQSHEQGAPAIAVIREIAKV